jgi:hypothetical protein
MPVVLALAVAAASAASAAEWAPNTWYATHSVVTYQGPTYTCIQGHTSQVGWEPPHVPALWALQASRPTPTATARPTVRPTTRPTTRPTVSPRRATPTSTRPTPTATGTATPTPTSRTAPTPTCGPRLVVTPSKGAVAAGETITVSVSGNVGLGTFHLTVFDSATGEAQSAADPIFVQNGPGGGGPTYWTWTLTAARAGSAAFYVSVHGETQLANCSYNWMTVTALSHVVTVGGAAAQPVMLVTNAGVNCKGQQYSPIRFRWSPIIGATAYDVWYSSSVAGPYTWVAHLTGTTWEAWEGHGYYRVRGLTPAQGPLSPPKLAMIVPPPCPAPTPTPTPGGRPVPTATSCPMPGAPAFPPPPAPRDLTAFPGLRGQVSLVWTLQDTTSQTDIHVTRRDETGGVVTGRGFVDGAMMNYFDLGLVPGRIYYYEVRAVRHFVEGTGVCAKGALFVSPSSGEVLGRAGE